MAVASPTSRFVRASAAGLRAWARKGTPGLLLVVPAGFCLVFLALFSPVVFQGNLLAPRDGKHFFIPAYRTLEKLWGPWELSGFPVVGDPQEMSWYPLSLLLSLWPGTWNVFVISGYVLAAFLMFLFVRELSDSESGLVAALSYSLGGFVIWNLSMINIVHSAAWLPGVLLGLEKLRKDPNPGWVAWTGGAAGCCVLAGHPQTAVYAGVVAIVFVGFSAARSRTGVAGYLAACAAAGVVALLALSVLGLLGAGALGARRFRSAR